MNPGTTMIDGATQGIQAMEVEDIIRGGKRGGAREHCSQKEMDQTSLGRRIPAKSTAFVAIFIKRAIYCTSAVGK